VAAKFRAIYRNGKLFAEYNDGELTYLAPEYSPANRSELPAPMVMRDIGEYRSPIDGTQITTRSQHRDHVKRHDVIEVGNEPIGSMRTPEYDTTGLGHVIKRRIEEVQTLPQADYDAHVHVQQAQHAEVASLITAG
jgi:hypothetical protein